MKHSYFIIFIILFLQIHSIIFQNKKILNNKNEFEDSYLLKENKYKFINQNYTNKLNEIKFFNKSLNETLWQQPDFLKKSKYIFFKFNSLK